MTLSRRLRGLLSDGHARDLALLEGDGLQHERPETPVDAAVLVAVTDRDRPGVILTQRPDTMRKHPGQVAFPGGRVDPEDADLVLSILSSTGQLVSSLPARRFSQGDHRFEWSTEALPGGVYVLHIGTASGQFAGSKKFIRQ